MKLCINCKKCETTGTSNIGHFCTTPEIQYWEINMRRSFVTGKVTPIYCDAARASNTLCGYEARYFEEHTQESIAVGKVIRVTTQELRELISGHSPTLQSVGRKEGIISKNTDKNKP